MTWRWLGGFSEMKWVSRTLWGWNVWKDDDSKVFLSWHWTVCRTKKETKWLLSKLESHGSESPALRNGINSQRRRERRFSGFETGQLGKISVFLNHFFLLLDGFEFLKCSALSPRGVRTAPGQPGEKTSQITTFETGTVFFCPWFFCVRMRSRANLRNQLRRSSGYPSWPDLADQRTGDWWCVI